MHVLGIKRRPVQPEHSRREQHKITAGMWVEADHSGFLEALVRNLIFILRAMGSCGLILSREPHDWICVLTLF